MEIAVTDPGEDDELTALVERARRGNSAAFDELARRVRDRVARWARRVVADGDDAEDIAQLVLVRVHERIDDFEGRSRFGSWLYRITRNVALERRRIDERRKSLLKRQRPAAKDTNPSLDTESDSAHLRQLVVAEFESLSPRQRDVFELVDLCGMSPSDVAERLGIEASTVRVLLLRARRTIRARMLEQHPDLLEDFRS